MFTKESLSKIRYLAIRKRVWFSALDAIERGILSISAKIINIVKSNTLNQQLVVIIDKLLDASKCGFVRTLERYGKERVKVIQSQAIIFGYKGAERLSSNTNFIRYLIFIDYNQPTGMKVYK